MKKGAESRLLELFKPTLLKVIIWILILLFPWSELDSLFNLVNWAGFQIITYFIFSYLLAVIIVFSIKNMQRNNWKNVFVPSIRKLIVFIVIFILSFVPLVGYYTGSHTCLVAFCERDVGYSHSALFWPIRNAIDRTFFMDPLGENLEYLSRLGNFDQKIYYLPEEILFALFFGVSMLYRYLLACLVVFAYVGIKNPERIKEKG
ncbi:hypothetical protein K8R30_04755 [archaeon]|nr:hypothetical protein [archaeon]